MKVFVTGASGFIGRALADRYRAAGAEVAGVDLRPDPARDVSEGDVSAPGAWQDRAAGADVVFHTAAYVGLRLRHADAVWRVNALGTRHAVDAARRGGARRFVQLSSVTVYGVDFPDGVDERHPPRSFGAPYADAKIASEQVALQAHAGGELEVTVVRPGDVYGPRSDAWAVRPVALMKAGRFAIPDGLVSTVYVDNLVDALVAAAAEPEAAGQVLTVTDGAGVPNREFFEPYARLVGRPLRVLPLRVALALATVAHHARLDDDVNPVTVRYFARRATYSNAKAMALLRWTPAVGFGDGMRRTCTWLKETGLV